MQRHLAAALVTAFAAACAAPGDDASTDDDTGGDVPPKSDSANPDGEDPRGGRSWLFSDVNGVANLDDDDGDGLADFDRAPSAADDDVSVLVFPDTALAALEPGDTVELSLSGDAGDVQIWLGGELLVGDGAGTGPVAVGGDDLGDIEISFGGFGAVAELHLDVVTEGGEVAHSATVALRSAPVIINHHLQPAEHFWAVSVGSNGAFIDTYESVLGDRFTAVSGFRYGGDVWIQDEIEFSALPGDQGQRLDVVIDSIRNRGLADFARDMLVGPGTIARTWGSGFATTYDSFGNLEASPPVTVDGVEYPFGRAYYGRRGNEGIHPAVAAFLADQKVQKPFALDTTWLCVGHVDEFSSFVPDPSSPKGFKLLIADTQLGWDVVQSAPAGMSIGRYGPDHGYFTAGDLIDDRELEAFNDEIQADYLDPILATFKDELGLTEADVIRVPALFERVAGCRAGFAVALVPGTVNLIVANVPGEPVRLFVPDPHFRPSGAGVSEDVFAQDFAARMPDGLEVHFVDNWDTYHLNLGEVHCGTNVRRTPTEDWWTAAAHLLGGQ